MYLPCTQGAAAARHVCRVCPLRLPRLRVFRLVTNCHIERALLNLGARHTSTL